MTLPLPLPLPLPAPVGAYTPEPPTPRAARPSAPLAAVERPARALPDHQLHPLLAEIAEDVWSRVDARGAPGTCWIWKGSALPDGAAIWLIPSPHPPDMTNRILASRIVAELCGAEPLERRRGFNRCGNKVCVRPDHYDWQPGAGSAVPTLLAAVAEYRAQTAEQRRQRLAARNDARAVRRGGRPAGDATGRPHLQFAAAAPSILAALAADERAARDQAHDPAHDQAHDQAPPADVEVRPAFARPLLAPPDATDAQVRTLLERPGVASIAYPGGEVRLCTPWCTVVAPTIARAVAWALREEARAA